MFKNYLKIALRNIIRQKSYSFINIAGLGVGLACFGLIALWIQDELSYDRYHPHAYRIYRITPEVTRPNGTQGYAVSAAIMAKTMLEEFPEVEAAVRFNISGVTVGNQEENKFFYEEDFCFTDPSAFDIFGFDFLNGDPESALSEPNTIVITEEMAQKFFSDENPLGKTLTIGSTALGVQQERDYTVTGVIRNVPQNTHFRRSFYASFATLEQIAPEQVNHWGWYWFRCYIRLAEGTPVKVLESKLPGMLERHADTEDREGLTIRLQSISDIHLYSDLLFDFPGGDIANVRIFSAIAVFILLLASINFMNLVTARSSKRSKEVGVKKVMGAQRKELILQFLGEAFVLCFIAGVLALGIIEFCLPGFNKLAEKQLSLNWGSSHILWGLLITIVIGIMSGLYPAFFISAFRPVTVLKQNRFTGSRSSRQLRKDLIVFQFVTAIMLIIATAIVYQQLDYFKHKALGFDKEQIVSVGIPGSESGFNFDVFKNEMLKNPNIRMVSRAFTLPGFNSIRFAYHTEEIRSEDAIETPTYSVDDQYADLLGLEFAAGRNFSRKFATDSTALILNEKAAATFGWSSPQEALGKILHRGRSRSGKIIGVVKDFHFASLRQPIGPMVMLIEPERFLIAAFKLAEGNTPATLVYLEDTYRTLLPERPFMLNFFDEELDNRYEAETRLGKIFSYFASLAIFIACLGLFGLASFTAEQRTREVGIRKVLGASVAGIVGLLSGEFLKLIGIAFLIASPIVYFLMNDWLSDFAYRIHIGLDVFFISGFIAFSIALLTVSFQAVKAAVANPVEALRSE
jgi:putative ABC transport system permease protein